MDEPVEIKQSDTPWLIPAGWTAFVAGCAVIFFALTAKTSVSSYSGYGSSSEVVNLSLLGQQELMFTGGVALVIVGAIFIAAGSIVAALEKRRA